MISRYSPKEFTDLWSIDTKYDTWTHIELTACKVMEKHGIIPKGIFNAVKSAKFTPNPTRIEEIEETTKHDVIAFLQHAEETIGEPARWLHFGMTSSDVVDTAFSMTLIKASSLLEIRAERLFNVLSQKARSYVSTPMIGRSHGMHAEPTTFGLVMAGHAAEIDRGRKRLINERLNISHGKVAGAVGTYAHLSPEIEFEILEELGLKPETVPTQIVCRDRYAGFFCALSILATSIERLAINIRHLSRSEIGELSESFSKGQKGSSAMPHKRNPIVSENLCGMARIVRSVVYPAFENMTLWHERDISHSSVERITAPDATSALAYMFDRAISLIDKLEVNDKIMMDNLNLHDSKFASEAIMLELIRSGMTRKQAYEIVQHVDRINGFKSGVFSDKIIMSVLNKQGMEKCFSLQNAIRYSDKIVDRTLGRPVNSSGGKYI